MLAKRIIACLDVMGSSVVKGVQFQNLKKIGNILELAKQYSEAGADELVFYDIAASSEQRTVDTQWINQVAREISIPFCVAGGIRSVKDAENVLHAGADKISINTPALERPDLITELSTEFGRQCVVVGIDSRRVGDTYQVYQNSGSDDLRRSCGRATLEWIQECEQHGAGEIVLNCMNADGMRDGYDIKQLTMMRKAVNIPLIASGGAGTMAHFSDVFKQSNVDGALAASVFHTKLIDIQLLKSFLKKNNNEVRL